MEENIWKHNISLNETLHKLFESYYNIYVVNKYNKIISKYFHDIKGTNYVEQPCTLQ